MPGYIDEIASKRSRLKIFVSSRTAGLKDERATVVQAIEQNPTAEAWYWERDAHSGPYPIEDMCVANARTSDGFVIILGEDLSPIVVKEFESAHDAGVPCYPFIKAGITHTFEVQDFVERIRRLEYVTKNFNNCSELRTYVTEALNFFSVVAVRRVIVWQRESRRESVMGFLISQPSVPEPFGLLLNQAEDLLHQGRARDALNLLLHIRDTSHELHSDRTAFGWMLNVLGLAYEHVGDRKRAEAALLRMRFIGADLPDAHLESIAAQNLGILALRDGKFEESRSLFRLSAVKREEISDIHGMVQLLLNLASLALISGDVDDAQKLLLEAAAGVELLADPELNSTLYGLQGTVAVEKSDYPRAEASFRKSLYQARRCQNGIKELQSLQNLGAVNADLGRYGRSVRWLRRALDLSESKELPRLQIEIHFGLAAVFHRYNRDQLSITHFRKARQLSSSVDDWRARAQASADLGALLMNDGSFDEAEECLNEAFDYFRNLDDREWLGRVAFNKILLFRKKDDIESAIELMEQALQIIPGENDRRAELLEMIAEASLATRRDPESSAVYYRRAILEWAPVLSYADLAYRSAQIGAALSEYGGDRQSISFYDNAVEIYERLDDKSMVFHTTNDRGNAFARLGMKHEARTDYERCLTISLELQDREMERQVSGNYGELLRTESAIEESLEMQRKCVDLSIEMNDMASAAWGLSNLSITLGDAGRWDEVRNTAKRAREIARVVHDVGIEADATGSIARAEFAERHFGRAVQLYNKAVKLGRTAGNIRRVVEDLGGLVQALSALGRFSEMETAAQELINLSQFTSLTASASESLSMAARWWLDRGDLDIAFEVYAISILLAATEPTDDLDLTVLRLAIVSPLVHASQADGVDMDGFVALLLSKLDERANGAAVVLQDMMAQARAVVESNVTEPGVSE